MTCRKIARDWFTETNNLTHDPVRALAAFVIMSAVGFTGHGVFWIGNPFDIQSFGIGMASLFAGVGAALGLKKDSTIEQGEQQL